jgi:hypothetical protein
MKILFILLLSFCSFGCATQPKRATNDAVQGLSQSDGVLLVSYARSNPKERFSTESVYFRMIGTRKRYTIGINTLQLVPLKFDFTEDGSFGSIAVFRLPAGRYELFDYAMTQDVFGGSIIHTPSRRFSIPFEVVPNAVSYVGELKIERIESARFLGLPNADKVRFDLTDEEARDTEIFKRLYPGKDFRIINAVPASDYSIPFIRIEK